MSEAGDASASDKRDPSDATQGSPAPEAKEAAKGEQTAPAASAQSGAKAEVRPQGSDAWKEAQAASRLKVGGVVLALVGAGFIALLAFQVSRWPSEPPEAVLDEAGGTLTVLLEGNATQGAHVRVQGVNGLLLANRTTDAQGRAVFQDAGHAGVVVNVTTGQQSWQRNVWVPEKAEVELKLGPDDPPTSDAWVGFPERPSGWAVAVQASIMVLIVAGGTAMALRRYYFVAMLGAALVIGLALQPLMFGEFLMGIALAGMGIWSIFLLRRGKHLFRRAQA